MDAKNYEESLNTITLETISYLQKLKNFRRATSGNIISKILAKKFNLILNEIEDLVDCDPDLIEMSESLELPKMGLDENQITTRFYCNFCQIFLSDNSVDIGEHIQSKHNAGISDTSSSICDKDYSSQKVENLKKSILHFSELLQQKQPVFGPTQINQTYLQNINPPEGFLIKYTQIEEFTVMISKVGPVFNQITLDIFGLLKLQYPSTRIYPYGSQTFGMANRSSDFNFFVDLGKTFEKFGTIVASDIFKTIRKKMEGRLDIWRICRQIINVRVPFIEVKRVGLNIKCVEQNIKCKLTFSNGIILYQQAALINYVFENRLCRKVAIMVRYLCENYNVPLSGYAIALLVIFYYQNKNVIPAVCHLQPIGLSPTFCGPWQVNFTKINNSLIIHDNVMNCWDDFQKFCQYYKNFDFASRIVNPFLAASISKKDLLKIQIRALPRYHAFYLQNPKQNSINLSTSMCIQDPIEQNINITENITRKEFNEFQILCNKMS